MRTKISSGARNANIVGRRAIPELADLVSVGPATIQALDSLGVRSVAQLARRDPAVLYKRLCRLRRQRQDPCCLDVFAAAVAQARNPELPAEQRVWWYWSQQRKAKAPHS